MAACTGSLLTDSETERNWDLDMAEDIKGEVEDKYGPVKKIKVDKMSRVSLPASISRISALHEVLGLFVG